MLLLGLSIAPLPLKLVGSDGLDGLVELDGLNELTGLDGLKAVQ